MCILIQNIKREEFPSTDLEHSLYVPPYNRSPQNEVEEQIMWSI